MLVYSITLALNANLNVDDTGNTFAGVLQGKYRVYIDPYAANVAADQYYVVGYKGSTAYDGGSLLLPICSSPDGSCRRSGHLPPKIASRPVTVLLLTHSQKELPQVSEDSASTQTVTTEESRLLTSCDLFSHISRGPSGPLFLCK